MSGARVPSRDPKFRTQNDLACIPRLSKDTSRNLMKFATGINNKHITVNVRRPFFLILRCKPRSALNPGGYASIDVLSHF